MSKSAKSLTCFASSAYARDTGQYERCAFSKWPSRLDDEKAKRYLQWQNRYLAFKEQLTKYKNTTRTLISAIPDLTSSTQDSSTATVFSTPLNPFNVKPGLKQAAILQKPETESSTAPPSLNPYLLTPPHTVETPAQAPKRKRRRIQFVSYLDDDYDAHGKQKRRDRHKKILA